MPQKVIIIGAGIAGLSAGSYLQMNGFETEIHELHHLPGGLCTSWEREGYKIDGCIHWLVGSRQGNKIYDAWNELVDMKKISFYDHDVYFQIEDSRGSVLTFFNDIDKLEKELLEKAPEDKAAILEYISSARKFSKMNLPLGKPAELYTIADAFETLIKIGPYYRRLKKYSKISIERFASRFTNPLLRKAMENLFVPEMSVVFAMITTAWMHNRMAGYPIGGSLEFARLISKRYQELGGTICYNSRITEILTRENRGRKSAYGVITAGEKTIEADYIISAADGFNTLFELLGGKYVDERTAEFYRKGLTFSSYLQLSLGVNSIIEAGASSLIFPLDKPVTIDPSTTLSDLAVRIHSFDPTLAPEGKTLVEFMIPTRADAYWSQLRFSDYKKYREEKDRIIREISECFGKRFGISEEMIEMTDLSTPATVIRYTNNWKGSFEGWVLTPEVGFSQMPLKLPGLSGFYMAGHWVSPGGGLPAALITGRGAAGLICRDAGKKFMTMHY